MEALDRIKDALALAKEREAQPERARKVKALRAKLRMDGIKHQVETLVEVHPDDVVAVCDSVSSPDQVVRELRLGSSRAKGGKHLVQIYGRHCEHLIAAAEAKQTAVTKTPPKKD